MKNYFWAHMFLLCNTYGKGKPFSDGLGACGRALIQAYPDWQELEELPLETLIEQLASWSNEKLPDPAREAQQLRQIIQQSFPLHADLCTALHDLLSMTISYLENELPAYVDHADAYDQACYAVVGDFEKALQSLERNLEHGHIGGWWFWSQLPQMEPLRGDPRFEAIMLAIREKVAAQRANLASMDDEVAL